ncbi:MAG: tetratricopeptide repeat protein [Candidatus Riflebacteria bacterium]|nr:tetratricopeptide repeat protein [Candidatus Riflebacteria bacterium]
MSKNLIVFLTFLAMSACSISFGSSVTLMEEALREKAAGNREKSISLLKQAVVEAKKNEQKVLARLLLGDFLCDTGQAMEAKEVFEEIIDSNVNPESEAEARFRLSQVFMKLNNVPKAKKCARDLMEKFPESEFSQLAKQFLSTSTNLEILAKSDITEKPENLEKKRGNEPDSAWEREPNKELKKETLKEPILKSGKESGKEVEKESGKASEKKSSKKSERPAGIEDSIDNKVLALLKYPGSENVEKESLAGKICLLQNKLKDEKNVSDAENILFELADQTGMFGESLEACRLYDKFLSSFPASPKVERAYFEAVRLRAILKAFPGAISWGKAFISSFPGSRWTKNVEELVEYAEKSQGKNISKPEKNETNRISETQKKVNPNKAEVVGNSEKKSEKDRALKEKRLSNARRLVREGKYSLALMELENISKTFPNDPEILLESGLVKIQKRDFKGAEGDLKSLLEQQPENAQARSMLGYIHYQSKDYEKAAAEYDRIKAPQEDGLAFFDPGFAAKRLEKTAKNGKRSKYAKGEEE